MIDTRIRVPTIPSKIYHIYALVINGTHGIQLNQTTANVLANPDLWADLLLTPVSAGLSNKFFEVDKFTIW